MMEPCVSSDQQEMLPCEHTALSRGKQKIRTLACFYLNEYNLPDKGQVHELSQANYNTCESFCMSIWGKSKINDNYIR